MDTASLVEEARAAAGNAYCPYSKYRVGAAFLGEDGRVYRGCNVENSSYGLTLCAERNALTTAVAAGCRKFVAMALVGGTKDAPAYPCGACRQVMAEFCGKDFPLTVAPLADNDGMKTVTLGELLPYTFELARPEN